MGYYDREKPFNVLVGKTLASVKKSSDRIEFVTVDGYTYVQEHYQDCCESVVVEDVNGDLDDLVGSPILFAEESTSSDDPAGYAREYPPESATWTFYRIGTIKGTVVIRWLGESNGYYSESVSFVEMEVPPAADAVLASVE